MDAVVCPSGQLKERYSPAVYFDSSILVDYWMAEGMELSEGLDENDRDRAENQPSPLEKTVRELTGSRPRLAKVAEVRRKVILGDLAACPVTSHTALWELQEWIAESAFKQIGAQVSGMILLQRQSKKAIGDYLKRAFELWRSEGEEGHFDSSMGASSGLHTLMMETWINLSFAQAHGLQGIIIADTVDFNWPPKGDDASASFADPYVLAFLQLGLADIMHVLLANHLGCRYFASFDSDFRRAREFIEDTGMTVLASPEQLLAVL